MNMFVIGMFDSMLSNDPSGRVNNEVRRPD
jgi:hypothetical protein